MAKQLTASIPPEKICTGLARTDPQICEIAHRTINFAHLRCYFRICSRSWSRFQENDRQTAETDIRIHGYRVCWLYGQERFRRYGRKEQRQTPAWWFVTSSWLIVYFCAFFNASTNTQCNFCRDVSLVNTLLYGWLYITCFIFSTLVLMRYIFSRVGLWIELAPAWSRTQDARLAGDAYMAKLPNHSRIAHLAYLIQ